MKNKIKRESRRHFDYSLLFVTVFVIGFGLIMIYSTSSYAAEMDYSDPMYYFKRQLLFCGLGSIAMYVFYRMDYHIYRKLAPFIMVLALLSVLALIPFGHSSHGATRWIVVGPISVQPAEIVKIAVIILSAAIFANRGTQLKKFKDVLIYFLLSGVVPALMVGVISSNMSSAVIIFLISAVMFFVAYPGYKFFAAVGGVVVAGACAVYAIIKNRESSGLSDNFRLSRILVWVNPEKYQSGNGYQTIQALYAIGSGGLFGKGLGKSLQKLGFIPESQNDMIFSVICEELGLFGAVCVMLLFALMIWRLVTIAQNAPDVFGAMLASGIFAHIAIQVVLNIAVVTNLIPNTGVSLPFISYGGSSLLLIMCEMGIALNISSQIKIVK